MTLHAGWRLACGIAAGLGALCAGAIQAQTGGGDGYTYAPSIRGSTGKFFMGRPIANIVDTGGAHWFDRPEREQEEGTDKLIPLLGLKPTDVVADIGAGTGYFSFRLARAVPAGKVFAQDIQPEMLRIVRDKLAADDAPKNIVPLAGTETDPSLPPGSVDLILIVDVWHEMLYPREMAQAMKRALKPGGRIAMVEYRGEDPEVNASNEHKMTEYQARREMAALGFRWVSTDSTTLPLHHLMIFAG